jgi:hypothetical protein
VAAAPEQASTPPSHRLQVNAIQGRQRASLRPSSRAHHRSNIRARSWLHPSVERTITAMMAPSPSPPPQAVGHPRSRKVASTHPPLNRRSTCRRQPGPSHHGRLAPPHGRPAAAHGSPPTSTGSPPNPPGGDGAAPTNPARLLVAPSAPDGAAPPIALLRRAIRFQASHQVGVRRNPAGVGTPSPPPRRPRPIAPATWPPRHGPRGGPTNTGGQPTPPGGDGAAPTNPAGVVTPSAQMGQPPQIALLRATLPGLTSGWDTSPAGRHACP